MSRRTTSGWVPFGLRRERSGERFLDWCDLGEERLADPFFDQTVHRRLQTAGRYRVTALGELEVHDACSERRDSLGFVFHMSRCGSTLIARMLASIERFEAVSEPAIVETILRSRDSEFGADGRLRALRGVTLALARRRYPVAELCVVKLASRATEDIGVFEDAFPAARWVFLYRDPVEVLTALVGRDGRDALPPGIAEAGLLPGDPSALRRMRPAEFWARVLGRRCEAAAAALASGRGRLLHYDDLPAAVWTSLLPHFGSTCSEAEIAILRQASHANAKRPDSPFAPDGPAKRQAAGDEIRAAVQNFVMPAYAALEQLRRNTAN